MPITATPPKQTLYAQNTQVVQVTGVQDALTGSFIDTMVMTLTLFDQNGNPINECDGVAFTYVPASNGNYQAIFGDEAFDPPVGSGYKLVIDGNDGSGNILHLELTAQVVARQS